MKFSILYMTIDRYPSCIESLEANLARSGVPESDIELLWADNGSKEREVVRALSKHRLLTYARISNYNEGIARTLNQLILRSSGKYVVQLGNDYRMPDGWLVEMASFAEKIKKTGMVGISWSDNHRGPMTEVDGVSVHLSEEHRAIFGVKLKTREMLDEVGAFDEMLHPYGFEDSDYHRRSHIAGFHNYYLPHLRSEHLGNDVGEKSDYRAMKDFSMKANGAYYLRKRKQYAKYGYYIPWPAKTEAVV